MSIEQKNPERTHCAKLHPNELKNKHYQVVAEEKKSLFNFDLHYFTGVTAFSHCLFKLNFSEMSQFVTHHDGVKYFKKCDMLTKKRCEKAVTKYRHSCEIM